MINAPFQATLGRNLQSTVFSHESQAGKALQLIDWRITPPGPAEKWPVSLQTCIQIMFSSSQPIFIWWGEEGTNFYNDACIPLLGDKHPKAMGQPISVLWKEIWSELHPKIEDLRSNAAPQTTPVLQLAHKDYGYQFYASVIQGANPEEFGIMCIGAPWEQSGFYFDKTDIKTFSYQILSQFDIIVQEAGLILILNLEDVSADVYINREMWEQAMLNLLTNAVKYTQTGSIIVKLSQENEKICLSVQDSGIGMNAPLISTIRESFQTTGIKQSGLQRLNEVVQFHKGEIKINSSLGEGSQFCIYLPVGKQHLPKEQIRNNGTVIYQPNKEAYQYAASNVRVFVERLRDMYGGAHYKQLLDCIPAAIYTCDKDGNVLLYNKAAEKIWGRAPKSGIDKWCGALKIYKQDGLTRLSLDECPMALAIKSGQSVRGEVIIVERPDGSRRIIQPYPDPLFDSSGRLYGAVNMLVDITDQKAVEIQDSRLAAIVESSDDAIVSKDLNGIITSWNPGAEQLFGYTADEVIGTSITRIIPVDKLDEEVSIIEQIRAGKKVDHFETQRVTKDGKYVDISLTISPIKDLKGNIVGASKIARDVTEQRQLFQALRESESKYMQLAFRLEAMVDQRTKELVESNKYLEKSNQELEQFAYVTSHDLQEPLRKIHTFAGMLYNVNKELLSGTSKMYLDKVMQSARRMSQLISELLDYSRLVHVQDPFVEMDLNEILKNVLTDYEVTISQHAVEVEVDNLPSLLVSPLQMNQLFHNLIGNAIKFQSPDRTPKVRISSRLLSMKELITYPDLDISLNYHLITISDNGIGFDQIYAEKIFQIFQRLNDRSAYDGTGIGLALCRKIVLNHKGAIFANSVVNEGTSFYVLLPGI